MFHLFRFPIGIGTNFIVIPPAFGAALPSAWERMGGVNRSAVMFQMFPAG